MALQRKAVSSKEACQYMNETGSTRPTLRPDATFFSYSVRSQNHGKATQVPLVVSKGGAVRCALDLAARREYLSRLDFNQSTCSDLKVQYDPHCTANVHDHRAEVQAELLNISVARNLIVLDDAQQQCTHSMAA